MLVKLIQKLNRNKKLELLFLLISIIYASVYLISPNFSAGDHFFNYLRIREVGEDLVHLKLPTFNLYTGSILGGAVSTYYPYLLFIPIAILSVFLSATFILFLIVSLGLFLGLNSSYYAAKVFNLSKSFRFVFTLLYSLSPIVFSVIYAQGDIGAYYALLIAIPFIFYGWYKWISKDSWIMLTLGMSLSIYCHIATSICVIFVLILLTAFCITKLNKRKILNLLRAIIVTILLTSFYWFPMLYLQLSNKVYLPSKYIFNNTQQPLIIHSIASYFAPQLCNIWGLMDLIAIILSIKYWRYLSQYLHKFFYISILVYIINIYPITIFLLNHTFLSKLQFLHRFSFISQFFLMIILSLIVTQILPYSINKKNYYRILYTLFAWISIVLIWGVSLQCYTNIKVGNKIYHPYVYKSFSNEVKSCNYYLETANHAEYNNQLNTINGIHNLPLAYPDYYPMLLSKMNKDSRILKIYPHFNEYTSTNKLRFESKDKKYHQIMATTYNTQRYIVKDNNKSVRFKSKHHMLYVKMHKGMNKIKIGIPIMWYRYLALVISIMGIILLIFS